MALVSEHARPLANDVDILPAILVGRLGRQFLRRPNGFAV